MDLFKNQYPQTLTLIFRSDDDGKSWKYVSELFPCFWGKMFIHKGELYMLSCSTEYGDLLIGKSTDGGKTFTEPVILLRGGNGKNLQAGVHKNPQPVVEFNGRLWNTIEWGSWGSYYHHAPMVISAPVDSDLLNPDSWEFSEPIVYSDEWEGVPKGRSLGVLEGCLTIINNKLYNIMRYQMATLSPNYGLALAFLVDDKNPGAPLQFSHTIKLDGNHTKFEIKYDEKTKKYYTIIARITSKENVGSRNLLSLMVSDDCKNWKLLNDIHDRRDANPSDIGFQYVDFIIEDCKIKYLCRTAINGAANFHDSNYITFGVIDIK